MTRIIAGSLGGRRIETPSGSDTRPTSDRVRESLFARLDSLGMLADSNVLDLFAGSGALGLEAISRGATRAVFVERAGKAAQVVKKNIRALDLTDSCSVQVRAAQPAVEALAGSAERFDVIFADPPYPLGESELAQLLETAAGLLKDDASLLVIERGARSPQPQLPHSLSVYAKSLHGETVLWLVERSGE